MEPETANREIAVTDAPDSGRADPLDAVTEFDLRALDHPCGVFRGTDVDGVLRVNDDFLALTGLSPVAARGWDWLAAVHADDRERLRRAVEAACRAGARSDFPLRMQVPIGTITTLRVAIRSLPTPDGSPGFVGAVESPVDAEERRTATRGATDAVDPFEVLVDTLPVAVAYVAPEGTVEYANPTWRTQVGSPEQLVDGCAGADGELMFTPVDARLGGGHVVTRMPSTDPPASIVARDRELAETAVRESELRFRTLAEHSTDLVVVVGPDLQPRYVSPAASRFLGVTAHDRFDPSSSVIHPDDVDELQAEMLRIAGGSVGARTAPILARFLRADGAYRWVELMVTNLLDEPLVGGLVVNARDMTERRDAEDQLRASEAKFRGLVQNLAEGVTVLAVDGSVKYSSPSAARMLGYEIGHGTGEIALDFVLEEDRERAAEIVAKAFSEPGIQGPVTLRILRPGDTTRVVEAMGHNRLDDPAVEGV
ncbi:MAG: PAS domain S-box protein, partial [Acidimicrobiia bacterium]